MSEKKYFKLNDVGAYKIAFHLSNYVWDIVIKWNYFDKDTVGKQWARAADSNSANIAEGFGRYHKKDKIKFYRYTYGSVKECCDWTLKAKVRELINQDQYDYIMGELDKLPREVNSLIAFTNAKLKF